MASWKLYVEDYGKIEKAEVTMAPLTLFVGDNNSGKSYLMSLLWGIQNIGAMNLFDGMEKLETPDVEIVDAWITEQITNALTGGRCEASVQSIVGNIERLVNGCLNKKKKKLLKWIFNSEDIKIGNLAIALECGRQDSFEFVYEEREQHFYMMTPAKSEYGVRFGTIDDVQKIKSHSKWFLIQGICCALLNISYSGRGSDTSIYLPAARTGFMLAKDVINKAGRDNTFNLPEEEQEITPFTRPINSFLDVMNSLSVEDAAGRKNEELVYRIEEEMAKGNVDISSLPGKEVLYIPRGKRKGMPLRVVSAVVSELSPLILILKHKRVVKTLFYEEPEMCLHPKLQHQMGKVLCELVNGGICVAATTHSDILLQCINNMIKLSAKQENTELYRQLGYEESDLLRPEQVKVYQLEEDVTGRTKVTEIACGEDGFAVPTFNDALDDIMEEAYKIQGQG